MTLHDAVYDLLVFVVRWRADGYSVRQELYDDLGGGADHDLALSRFFGIVCKRRRYEVSVYLTCTSYLYTY